jgi:Arc/MetJ family transcription regulator
MNAQIGMDINERARRALTRVPPSVRVTDEMVADVADALRGAIRSAYQNAAVIATSRTHAGESLEDSRARRAEAQALAELYEKLANESR